MLTDLISLLLAFGLAIYIRTALLGAMPPKQLLLLWPIFVLFIVAFAWRGLLPAVGLSPVDELRITTGTVSLDSYVISRDLPVKKTTDTYSRFILTVAWLISLGAVQVNRWICVY